MGRASWGAWEPIPQGINSSSTPQRYYTNPGNQACFPCALANLLLELGDDETAQHVYGTFWQHRLARRYCSLFLLPRYVADLTGERYRATLSTTINPDRMMRIMNSFPTEKRRAAETELNRGRIRFASFIQPPPRSIVIVPRQTSCHAMLYCGRHSYIDDGRPTVYPFAENLIVASVEIQPRESAEQLQLLM